MGRSGYCEQRRKAGRGFSSRLVPFYAFRESHPYSFSTCVRSRTSRPRMVLGVHLSKQSHNDPVSLFARKSSRSPQVPVPPRFTTSSATCVLLSLELGG